MPLGSTISPISRQPISKDSATRGEIDHLRKRKKQDRLIGFFHYCLRLGRIRSTHAVLLGRIRADGPPTDYFPKHEFDRIIDASYIYQPKAAYEVKAERQRSV